MVLEAGSRVSSAWKVSAALLLSWMICVLFSIALLWSTNNIRQDLRDRLAILEIRERHLERKMLNLQRKCSAAQASKEVGASDAVGNTISGWQGGAHDQRQFTDKVRVYADAGKKFAALQHNLDGTLDWPKDDTQTSEWHKLAVPLEEQVTRSQISDKMEKVGRTRRNNDNGALKSWSSITDTKAERIARTAKDTREESAYEGSSTEVSVADTRERKAESADQNSQKIPDERSQRTGVVWVTKDNPIASEIIRKYPIKPYYSTPIKLTKKEGYSGSREDGLVDDEDMQEGSGCHSCSDIQNYVENVVRQMSIQTIKEIKRDSVKRQVQLKCREATTEWNTTYSIGVSKFLASHVLTCNKNELLQSVLLKGNTDEFFPLYRYEYRCCTMAEVTQV